MTYEVRVTRTAEREALDLPDLVFEAVNAAVRALALVPRPPGCKRLKGVRGRPFRLRVGNYRVLYTVDDRGRAVTVFRIAHRRHVYRNLR